MATGKCLTQFHFFGYRCLNNSIICLQYIYKGFTCLRLSWDSKFMNKIRLPTIRWMFRTLSDTGVALSHKVSDRMTLFAALCSMLKNTAHPIIASSLTHQTPQNLWLSGYIDTYTSMQSLANINCSLQNTPAYAHRVCHSTTASGTLGCTSAGLNKDIHTLISNQKLHIANCSLTKDTYMYPGLIYVITHWLWTPHKIFYQAIPWKRSFWTLLRITICEAEPCYKTTHHQINQPRYSKCSLNPLDYSLGYLYNI